MSATGAFVPKPRTLRLLKDNIGVRDELVAGVLSHAQGAPQRRWLPIGPAQGVAPDNTPLLRIEGATLELLQPAEENVGQVGNPMVVCAFAALRYIVRTSDARGSSYWCVIELNVPIGLRNDKRRTVSLLCHEIFLDVPGGPVEVEVCSAPHELVRLLCAIGLQDRAVAVGADLNLDIAKDAIKLNS